MQRRTIERDLPYCKLIVICRSKFRLNNLFRFKACVAIFYQISIFSPNDSPLKTMKNVFISSKKHFSFLRYSKFCDFFPSFPHFPNSKGQLEVE